MRGSTALAAGIAVVSLLGCGPRVPEDVRGGRSEAGLEYDLTGAGPVVVLIHGSNLDRRMWEGDVGWLSKRARVLTYDIRAHGGSDVPTEAFANHEDLLGLLDEIGADEVTIIGLSFGAHVALDTALEAPDRVDRLVLVSPSIQGYQPEEVPPFFAELGAALQAEDYEQANEVLLASPLMAVPAEHAGIVRTMLTDNGDIWSVPFSLVKLAEPPVLGRLAGVGAPTLILVGDADLAAVQAQGRLLDEQIPNSTLITVPDGGHLLNLTSPVEFRGEIGLFLDSD